MARLTGISGRRAIKAFLKIGYAQDRVRGSHAILVKDDCPMLVIPLHKEVSPFLLGAQVRRAGLNEDEFLKLLRGK